MEAVMRSRESLKGKVSHVQLKWSVHFHRVERQQMSFPHIPLLHCRRHCLHPYIRYTLPNFHHITHQFNWDSDFNMTVSLMNMRKEMDLFI